MPMLLSLFTSSGPVKDIIDKLLDFIPDPAEKAKQQAALQQAIMDASIQADKDQRAIDQAEASNASMFVAGWRPAVGWLCVGTLAYTWVLAPMATWFSTAIGHPVPALPTLTADEAQTLLYAMLGIGGLRTVDKMTGNATQGIVGTIAKAITKK